MNKKDVLPALFSIIDTNDNINVTETRKYIRYLLKKGIKGFYINGSTGEAFMLSLKQRKRALEIIKEETNEKCFLMVQVGTISTQESIALAQHASSVGVDVISAIMPFYFKFSWQEIAEHYEQIMNSVNVDFCPYHIPHLSGVSVTRENLCNLLKHPKVKYLKYSATDFYILQRLKSEHPNVDIMNGCDEMLLSGLASGANGAIGSTYNFTYKKAKSLVDMIRQGDIKSARKYQDEINDFVDMLLRVGLLQGMKYLLSKVDIDAGVPVRPFLPISEENKKLVDSYVREHPEILE